MITRGVEVAICWVKPGWCGYEVAIEAREPEPGTMAFTTETACPHITRMCETFKTLNIGGELSSRMTETKTYKMAAEFIPCVSCSVPSAILKTAEVLSGRYKDDDAVIKFLHFFDRS